VTDSWRLYLVNWFAKKHICTEIWLWSMACCCFLVKHLCTRFEDKLIVNVLFCSMTMKTKR